MSAVKDDDPSNEVEVLHAESDPYGRVCGPIFAFVVVLFGSDPGCCVEAVVLGKTLTEAKTRHNSVMLHTVWRGVHQFGDL